MARQDLPLAAYALGAVDDVERTAIERHLADSPEARAEVARHFEVVEALGALHATPPPSSTWDRIAGEIAAPPPVRRPAWPALGVAAAVLAALLGVVVIAQQRQIARLDAALTQGPLIADAETTLVNLAAPGTETIEMTIALGADGRASIAGSDLARLPDDLVYQLWAIMDDGRIISVALLDGDPATFVVATDGLAGFAVTAEIDGGVVSTTNEAVAVGMVDA